MKRLTIASPTWLESPSSNSRINQSMSCAVVLALTAAVCSAFSEHSEAQPPGIAVRVIDVSGNEVNSTTEAFDIALSLGATQEPYDVLRDVTAILPALNVGDEGTFGGTLLYPGGYSLPGDEAHFVVTAFANLTIPAGQWQIAFGTDDGGSISLAGVNFFDEFGENGNAQQTLPGDGTLRYEAPRGHQWTGGTIQLDQPTTAALSGVFFEQGGQDSFEIAIRDASAGSLSSVDPADGWILLGDGALGWQVATDVAAGRRIGGQSLIGSESLLRRHLQNAVEGNPVEQSGLLADVYHGNFDSIADWDAVLADQPFPMAQGTIPDINWASHDRAIGGGGYPEAFGFDDPENREAYSVRAQGELLVSQNGPIRFTDGTDDYAYLAIDLDGDGVIQSATEVLIDDDGAVGVNGRGSPIAIADFSNVAAGGEYRRLDFRMAEDAGFDAAVLYWDQNIGAPSFPSDSNTEARPEHLVPASAFRTTVTPIVSGDLVAGVDPSLPLVFGIYADALTSDQIGLPVNPDPARFRNVLNVDDASLVVELLAGVLEPGQTFDLIDEANVDEIVGTPQFQFPYGEWDTSTFTSDGRIMFLSGSIEPPAGKVNSTWNQSTGGSWNDPDKWNAGVPNAPGSVANFEASMPASPAAVTLTTPVTVEAIRYSNPGSLRIAGTATLSFAADSEGTPRIDVASAGSSLDLGRPIDFSSAPLSIHVNEATSEARISGGISNESLDLTKTGPGRLILSGNSEEWQGTLHVNEGLVHVLTTQGLGTSDAPTIVTGGSLQLKRAIAEPLQLDGGAVYFNDSETPHTAPISVRSGTIGSRALEEVTIAGPIELVDGGIARVDVMRPGGIFLIGGVSGQGDLHFASEAFVTVEGEGLSHDGDVVIEMGTANLSFRVPNSYSGTTWINSGGVRVTRAGGLGSAEAGTVVNGGVLTVEGDDNEPVRVNDGILRLYGSRQAPVYRGRIELAGGELDSTSFRQGTVIVAEPVAILPDAPVTISGGNDDVLILDGGIVGSGDLTLEPREELHINGPFNFDGDVRIEAGGVHINATDRFDGRMILENGTLMINEDYAVSELHFLRGGVIVAEGKTLTSDAFFLSSGTIDGAIAGVDTLRKVGLETVHLIDLGPQFDPAIQIAAGAVIVSGATGLGGTQRATSITRERNALLRIGRGAVIADDLHLQNASGFAYGGAIALDYDTGNAAFGTVTGTIQLGDRGAIVGVLGGSPRSLQLDGQIAGGELTVNATEGSVQLRTDGHTFSGPTRIVSGQLLLSHAGRLTDTSEIIIQRTYVNTSELQLNNSQQGTRSDRVADHIAVRMYGGELNLHGHDGVASTETLGSVVFENGQSSIGVLHEDFPTTSELTINHFERKHGATVDFNSLGAVGLPSVSGRVHLANAALDDGILGGWATTASYLVTVGELGLRPLMDNETDISLVTPQSNFEQDDATALIGDTIINSLRIFTDKDLDLNGKTLVVDSGGILKTGHRSHSSIVNGTLTSGGPELFAISQGEIGISATITDNEGRPVSLVKSGDGLLTLSSPHSYSGSTFVNSGRLRIETVSALPPTTSLEINGDEVVFYIDGSNDVEFASLAVRNQGVISDNAGVTRITAGAIEVESGYIGLPLAGSGTLRKSSLGVVRLAEDNSQFSGDVQVEAGILSIEHPNGLSNGNHFINGGILSLGQRQLSGDVTLNGGVLGFAEEPNTRLHGDIVVTSHSEIDLFDVLQSAGDRPQDFVLAGDLTIREDQELRVNGKERSSFTIQGDLVLEPGARLTGSATIQGTIDIAGGASVAPGSSPGEMYIANMNWFGGGKYLWEINDAEGAEGAPTGAGWDRLGTYSLSAEASANDPFVIKIVGLNADNELGKIRNFDPAEEYDWRIVDAEDVGAFSPDGLKIDAQPFLEHNPISSLGSFELSRVDGDLFLSYRLRELAGDYNSDGKVDQADLDLVLLNWGDSAQTPPHGWTSDLPSGLIDQDELDGILLNWGVGTSGGGIGIGDGAVPEPVTLAILATVVPAFLAVRRLRR